MTSRKLHNHKAWIISVDMGYGHQRAAAPLRHLAQNGRIVTCNTYPGIPTKDRRIWQESRKFYEFISRFKQVPVLGSKAWQVYDSLQKIPNFYPKRDLSKMSFQVKKIYDLIENENWGKHLIDQLAKKPLPLVTTFFVPAFMAEAFNYPGDIYCLTTDTDINRAWAPKHPASSRINYFAPNYRVVERLKLYGVRSEQIFLTGFPLPLENIGNDKLDVLKADLTKRLVNLDPKKNYYNLYHEVVKKYLGIKKLPAKSGHRLTLMFAVGGAGAQREIGAQIITSLRNEVITKKIRLVLVAGIHNNVSNFFKAAATKCGLKHEIGQGVEIIYDNTKDGYFRKFNKALRTTDILWTKPSELSFYVGLGVPIIIAPPIGSQEDFNRKWLRTIGAAVSQDDPKHANQWVFDWVDSGWFAEAAMQGFVEAPKFGTYNIEQIIFHRSEKAKKPKMVLQY
ncbi:MAG: hypothetical protein HUU49_00465 [Candidatus Buchananbacteria bacterium]|nr:hypothetical protein [Candidatus Buchananbacteria bacterium]